ncbi:MAG TPA: glycosyltransferase family 39 protein [Streptosporangiaceae bacterium]|nr:glycosyltransferase family 39 protein [Streptosporangiaceae bacterium]
MPQPETSAQHGSLTARDGGAPAVAPETRPADAAEARAPDALAPQAAGPSGRDPVTGLRNWGRRVAGAWPLLVVLGVQAALSVRLLHADTAFQDEAAYLWAGHLQWAHWLHGTSVPPFPYYFSGAPVIYPPLGALADGIGGLAAARALSLVFMLGTTGLAWGTTARLFGRRAAFFAAALFAVLGPTLHLGAFATYNAMALFLIALAAWFVVRAGDRGDAVGWMVAAGAALALANAASYTSVLFDVFVLALAVLVVTAALLTAGLLLGGGSYLSGFERTTLARVPGSESALSVLADSWSWAGLIFALALCGVIISWAGRRGWAQTTLLAVLAIAVVAGPLEQARLHTAASLNKHVGLGAWFAVIAAGYAIDRFIAAAPDGRAQAVTTGACVAALAFPAVLGASQSWQFSTSWPNATSFIAVLRPFVSDSRGPMLVEDPAIAEYYLSVPASQWRRWSSTRNIVMPSGASTGHPTSQGIVGAGNPAAYTRYIARHYFTLVALNFADTTALDLAIRADLRRYHYKVAQVIPYGIEVPPLGQGTYVIYRYEPAQ